MSCLEKFAWFVRIAGLQLGIKAHPEGGRGRGEPPQLDLFWLFCMRGSW